MEREGEQVGGNVDKKWVKNGLFLGFIFAVSLKKNYPSGRWGKQGKSRVFCTPYKVKKYVFFNIRL